MKGSVRFFVITGILVFLSGVVFGAVNELHKKPDETAADAETTES